MKLLFRVLALALVVAGASAASVSSSSAHVLPSHQAAPAAFPVPGCGPNVPMCNGVK